MIPRVLHQTWRTSELPAPMQACRQSWLSTHPHWTHALYDDAACRAEIALHHPDWLATWEALPRPVMRADVFRWLVIHRLGGLYADLDMWAHRAVDADLDGARCVLAVEAWLGADRQRELGYRRDFQLANCIFAAEPGHPLVSAVLEAIREQAHRPVNRDADVEEITGPRLLTRVVQAAPPALLDGVRVLPQVRWMAPDAYPAWFFGGVHARHQNHGTWKTEPGTRDLRRRWVERNRLPWPWARRGPAL